MPDNVMQARDPDDVPSGSRPIEGVGTAVAAFVGLAAKGPAHEPTLVRSWTEYAEIFGGYMQNAYLAHAVNGYFLNGGHAAYIVRVATVGSARAFPSSVGSRPSTTSQSWRHRTSWSPRRPGISISKPHSLRSVR